MAWVARKSEFIGRFQCKVIRGRNEAGLPFKSARPANCPLYCSAFIRRFDARERRTVPPIPIRAFSIRGQTTEACNPVLHIERTVDPSEIRRMCCFAIANPDPTRQTEKRRSDRLGIHHHAGRFPSTAGRSRGETTSCSASLRCLTDHYPIASADGERFAGHDL